MAIEVNVDNFARAEVAAQVERFLAFGAAVNDWTHIRTPTPLDQQSVIRFQFVQTLLEQRGQVIVRLGIQRDYRRRTRLGEPVQERAVPAALATAVARCVAGHHFQPVPQGFLGFEGPCVADDAKEGFLEGVPGLGFLPAGDDQQELLSLTFSSRPSTWLP